LREVIYEESDEMGRGKYEKKEFLIKRGSVI